MQSYEYKLVPLVLLGFCFSITMCLSSVYAAPSAVTIDTHTVGGTSFTFGDVITPSEQDPLFFHFNSADSLTYTCRIVKIDQDLLDKLNAAPTEAALKQIALVGTEISNENCGTGTDGSVTYAQSFSDGLYAFEVIGTGSDGTGTKSNFAFEALGGQALLEKTEESAKLAALTKQKVTNFWTTCDQTLKAPGATPAADINLQKIVYTMEGRSKIDNLKFDSNNLNLKVKTSTLNDRNELSGEFTSASSEDFTIQNVDTQCIYHLPEKAGQLLVPGPTTAFNPATLDSWNPPVPTCNSAQQFNREITYPFKVTSNLAELKDTGKRNVEVEITVDNTPKPAPDHNGIDVTGKLTLDGNKQINIEIAGEPKVECSGGSIPN